MQIKAFKRQFFKQKEQSNGNMRGSLYLCLKCQKFFIGFKKGNYHQCLCGGEGFFKQEIDIIEDGY